MNIFTTQIPDWLTMKCEAIRLRLEGIEEFKKLTQEEKDKEWNGIGPDRFPAWFRNALSVLHKCVLPAACIHDFDFVVGGTIEEFHAANKRMKRNMKVCLKDSRKEFSFFGYHLARWRVHTAYRLVEKYGLPGWRMAY